MTTRLDLLQPELLTFDAAVLAVRRLGERVAVVLDRTAFYPEGGGQPADRGRLSGVAVVDVQEVDGEVLHAVEGELPVGPGGRVHGEVDPGRRRDHLQQHHGQHLLSAAFEKTAGAATLSFHLGEDACTIDLDRPLAGLQAVLRAAEACANELVFRDLPVTTRDFTPEELARLPLRKAPARGARVVVVAAVPLADGPFDAAGIEDASPCGGTHPRRTGEVGAIAVLRAQRWGPGARVEFVCGGRVVRALAEAGQRLQEAAQALRCAPAEVAEAAARAAEDGAARRKELTRLTAALAEAEADRLAAGVAAPGAVRAVVAPPAGSAPAWASAVAHALAARGRTAFLGAVEGGRAHLAFARPRPGGKHAAGGADMAERMRTAAATLGGKGGGAPDSAQGSGPEVGRLDAALDEAARGA